ncbi:synergin gamma [Ditylenchus destructor]|nr:synergin gamma [Ditylenchus destructor]
MPLSLNTNRIASGSGIVPPTLLDEKRIPKFYQDAIAMCGAPNSNQYPNTAQVCKLMSLSQLPQSVLGNIWSLVNRTKPGQLTREEFYSCLALIALAQKGESLSALCDVTTLPIPFIQTFTVNTKPNAGYPNKDAQNAISKQEILTHFTTKSTFQTPNRTKDELLQDLNNLSINSPKSKESRNHSRVNMAMSAIIPTSLNPQITEDESHTNIISMDFIDFNAVPTLVADNTENGTSVSEPFDSQKLSERVTVWKQCLWEATLMFREAIKLFVDCLNSAQVASVMETECGDKYVMSLKAVYSVVQRINRSLERYANDSLSDKLREVHDVQKDAHSEWNSLNAFLCQETLYANGEHNYDLQPSNSTSLCGICIQSLDTFVSGCEAIEFLSHTYHSQCANFYLNRRIGALLPNLI